MEVLSLHKPKGHGNSSQLRQIVHPQGKTGIKAFEGKQQEIYTYKSIDECGNGTAVMIMVHSQVWEKNKF